MHARLLVHFCVDDRMETCTFWLVFLLGLAVSRSAQEPLCNSTIEIYDSTTPYLQVYPEPVDRNKTPLYFALVLSFGGQYLSSGSIPGVQVALDQINRDASILPGYELRYTLIESVCNRTRAIDTFFHQIFSEPTKIAVIGSGCSVNTEPTAEISSFYNLNQLSCVSSSPELTNRVRFKNYFQLLVSDQNLAFGFYSIIQRYKWRRVSILLQDENLFTLTMDLLRNLLLDNNVISEDNIFINRFKSSEGIAGLGEGIFHPETRVYVIAMYSVNARQIICQAAQQGLKYPRYAFLTYGWFPSGWWDPDESHSFECAASRKEIIEVMANILAPFTVEFFEETNKMQPLDSGIYGHEYASLYEDHLNDPVWKDRCPRHNLTSDIYGEACYDATWTLARALNSYMKGNATTPLQNFTYSNSDVRDDLFRHLTRTNFSGLTGTVMFRPDGTREVNKMIIEQYIMSTGGVTQEVVGRVLINGGNASLEYIDENITDLTIWPDGIPFDGIPNEEVVSISLVLTVFYYVVSTAGLVFAAICLGFNFIFRNAKLIRLTSPNLNYVIGVGAIIFYVDVILLVTPSIDSNIISGLCNTTLWLTAIGYSLCFGPILVKMVRVFYIFNNPRPSQKIVIKDWMLLTVVFLLVLVDLTILTVYTVVVGIITQLGPVRVPNTENTEDKIGSTGIVYEYYVLVCQSTGRNITIGLIYGYKALLQAMGLIFAFSTRKVKVKGLDDSKYVGAAIYVTSIVLAVTVVSSYTLITSVNIYGAVIGAGLSIGSTIILALSFLPKMIALYQDPKGNKVMLSHQADSNASLALSGGINPTEEVEVLKRKIIQQKHEQAILKERIALLEASSNGERVDGADKQTCISIRFADNI